MKKIIPVAISFILISVFTVSVFASDAADNVYTYCEKGVEYTVDFSDSSFSEDIHDAIAQKLLGLVDNEVQTYGLMCTIFGHKYETSEVSVITHKVYKYSPRCQNVAYDVSVCTRCDHQEQKLLMTSCIVCCPED